MWNECNCTVAWTFFGISLLWVGMKTDFFQSCGHCWVFQICWRIQCSLLTVSSFRIWNSSVGFPSPPLALFVVMLPKAHLTSHSRMSGSRCMTTPSWLFGWLRPFLYSPSMYTCLLFINSSASVWSLSFLSFIMPSLHENFYLQFNWRDLYSFPFCCFPLFLCIDHWGRLSYLSLLFSRTVNSLGFIFPFLLSLLFLAICKASSDSHFVFLHFFFFGLILVTISYTMLRTSVIVLQTLCLSDLIPWIYLSSLLYNQKGFDLGHTWVV